MRGAARVAVLEVADFVGHDGLEALAEALKVNSGLRLLNLRSNPVGTGLSLGDALKSNHVLEVLDLGQTTIGDEGALSLAEGLKSNGGLHTLDLQGLRISEEVAEAVATVLNIHPKERILHEEL